MKTMKTFNPNQTNINIAVIAFMFTKTRCVSGLRPSLAHLRYGLQWVGKSEMLDAKHMMQIANKSKSGTSDSLS